MDATLSIITLIVSCLTLVSTIGGVAYLVGRWGHRLETAEVKIVDHETRLRIVEKDDEPRRHNHAAREA